MKEELSRRRGDVRHGESPHTGGQAVRRRFDVRGWKARPLLSLPTVVGIRYGMFDVEIMRQRIRGVLVPVQF